MYFRTPLPVVFFLKQLLARFLHCWKAARPCCCTPDFLLPSVQTFVQCKVTLLLMTHALIHWDRTRPHYTLLRSILSGQDSSPPLFTTLYTPLHPCFCGNRWVLFSIYSQEVVDSVEFVPYTTGSCKMFPISYLVYNVNYFICLLIT